MRGKRCGAGLCGRLAAGLVLAAMAAGAPPAAAEVVLGTLVAAQPQPSGKALHPGLRVSYAYAYFNHIDEMLNWERTEPGAPVAQLNAKASDKPVLTSQEQQGVGARLEGLLHLPEAGSWRFKVNSNDGVRIRLGGRLLYEDPFRHAARLSDELLVEVDRAGWYPLQVGYYQAKGDWTLELFWQPPDGDRLEHVPAEAFAHVQAPPNGDPVAAARIEAERILRQAHIEATQIVKAARREAEAILAETRKKAGQ